MTWLVKRLSCRAGMYAMKRMKHYRWTTAPKREKLMMPNSRFFWIVTQKIQMEKKLVMALKPQQTRRQKMMLLWLVALHHQPIESLEKYNPSTVFVINLF